MKRCTPRLLSLSVAALAAAMTCIPAQAAPRAYVASDGNDARANSGCPLAGPCRSFQAAHNAVDSGGEIVALDTADYGPVTIGKSVSILGGSGFVAGIVVAAGNGVTIAKPGLAVVLRNLTITGAGGVHGVAMTAGDSLTLENCVISQASSDGVAVSGVADARIVDSLLRGNGGHGASFLDVARGHVVNSRFMGNGASGLVVHTAGNLAASTTVNDSLASGNAIDGFALRVTNGRTWMGLVRATASNNGGSGFRNERLLVLPLATMSVGGSTATGNAAGFNNSLSRFDAPPHFESLGNNIVRGNAADVLGVPIQTFSGL